MTQAIVRRHHQGTPPTAAHHFKGHSHSPFAPPYQIIIGFNCRHYPLGLLTGWAKNPGYRPWRLWVFQHFSCLETD
jgi:hypothetical protein